MTKLAVEVTSEGDRLTIHVEAEGLSRIWRFMAWTLLPLVFGGTGVGVTWHLLAR